MLCETKPASKKQRTLCASIFVCANLLHSGRARRLVAGELPAAGVFLKASNAIDDYQCMLVHAGTRRIRSVAADESTVHLLRVQGNFFARVQGWPLEFPNREISLATGRPYPPSCNRQCESAFARLV